MIHEVPSAITFFKQCLHANSPRVAVENPHMHPMAKQAVGSANCVVQPWHHGHPYTKKTLLWLRGLPPLMPTQIVGGELVPWINGGMSSRHAMTGNKKDRARSFPGIAAAMADQWGDLLR